MSAFRQQAGEHLQSTVFLGAQAVDVSLEDTNVVVEFFDQASRELVRGTAVSGDAVPGAAPGWRLVDEGLRFDTHRVVAGVA